MKEPSAHRDNAREDALKRATGDASDPAPSSTTASGATPGTAPDAKKEATLPQLGFLGMLRWAWTQLTSMRTALFLLLLLAVAAVPGSIFPQRVQDAFAVETWIEDNPTAGPILDFFQLFDVYSSVWFSAIYLLLFISLIGCIIPRARKHWQQMRSAPPRTPRRLERLPEYGALELEADGPDAERALQDAAGVLRRRRYRVDVRPAGTDARGQEVPASVGAERGYLKETGNLVFHIALVGVLICVALGSVFSYRGQKVLMEDEGFVNALVAYDNFYPGTYFDEEQLHPFSVQLDGFERVFDRESATHFGQALDFTADVTVRDGADGEPQQQQLKVNEPLTIGGTRLFLVGNGYAPEVTVRDGDGEVAFSGPVVTRPDDQVYTSMMVLKVPDAQPEQLGFVGLLLPTAHDGDTGAAMSVDPELGNPELQLNSYYGDLGLDEGVPQNVYVLDTDSLTTLNSRELEVGGIELSPGETYDLPEDMGSITYEDTVDYIAMDIHYNPAQLYVLGFALLALTGLIFSLFIRRRRAWVTVTTTEQGRTLVSYGLLSRGEDFRLRDENIALRRQLEKIWPVRAPEEPETGSAQAPTADAQNDDPTTRED
ncbi:cytochrome c biogenesis protein ResB [Nesterenkonia aerolata]|uniref:Cytochrome c biogenesis protein ResB n=1 Tax=Nesterenkonia aerolata TaxID=3074079 RepID=A0ABU2DT43_9MICC|nr:cytochrome c biogenesis protein ResB [Nesterenkonia sp. LY-0111]MDR8019673.1 cytochrome c biogenesis protein ResB [Nesterenkonia sp. LY-0111]